MVIIQIPGFKINRLESELKEHLPLITTATITRKNEITNSSARLALIITHTHKINRGTGCILLETSLPKAIS